MGPCFQKHLAVSLLQNIVCLISCEGCCFQVNWMQCQPFWLHPKNAAVYRLYHCARPRCHHHPREQGTQVSHSWLPWCRVGLSPVALALSRRESKVPTFFFFWSSISFELLEIYSAGPFLSSFSPPTWYSLCAWANYFWRFAEAAIVFG